ncbi:MAG: 50S ribosomal protein L10 [Candidatus Verstraetearchaeota archaeon]|nr:50S ribosomal protein L10 [Candidatus Verstraetearchaeota archaeon]
MTMQRKTPSKKENAVKDLEALFQKYPIFAIADLKGLKASQLQVLKKKFKDDLEIHVAKNTLVKRAMERLAKKYVKAEEITRYLSGPNAYVFSNKNPFSLYLMFERNKVESAASPGDIAPNDIVVSAGNTGLQPGPILSKFGAAKIPTKIQDGSVWIAKDTVAANKGDAISADTADLLSKLGLKPIMVGLKLRMAYDSGVIPGDVLCINLDEYKANMKVAVEYAVNLSVNAVYPTKETAPLLIAKAYAQARGLAVKSGMPIPEVIGEVMSLAERRGKALAEAVSKKHPELKL